MYSLLRGRKSFSLWAPSDSPRLYPSGELERVHPNGRIVYRGAPCRPDGADAGDVARVAELSARARAGERQGRLGRRAAEEAALEAALEEDVLLGSGRDDFCTSEDEHAEEDSLCDGEKPPHFSTIVHSRLDAFPLFGGAVRIDADLAAGDSLYLPVGWWHNVTSWSAPGEQTHMALNHWFHPPDGTSFEKPYTSDLWAKDFQFWKKDILPTLA